VAHPDTPITVYNPAGELSNRGEHQEGLALLLEDRAAPGKVYPPGDPRPSVPRIRPTPNRLRAMPAEACS
jgi:hypothetical protein